jgi:hypothetical protein
VRPYSKGQKDFRDAEAIAEAVQRPTMKFVPRRIHNNQLNDDGRPMQSFAGGGVRLIFYARVANWIQPRCPRSDRTRMISTGTWD